MPEPTSKHEVKRLEQILGGIQIEENGVTVEFYSDRLLEDGFGLRAIVQYDKQVTSKEEYEHRKAKSVEETLSRGVPYNPHEVAIDEHKKEGHVYSNTLSFSVGQNHSEHGTPETGSYAYVGERRDPRELLLQEGVYNTVLNALRKADKEIASQTVERERKWTEVCQRAESLKIEPGRLQQLKEYENKEIKDSLKYSQMLKWVVFQFESYTGKEKILQTSERDVRPEGRDNV